LIKKDIDNVIKQAHDEIDFLGGKTSKQQRNEYREQFKKTLTYELYYAHQEDAGKKKQSKVNQESKNNKKSKGKEVADD
jgi:hypothetical protein